MKFVSLLLFLVCAAPDAAAEEGSLVAWQREGVPIQVEIVEGSYVEYVVEITTLFGTTQHIVGRSEAVRGSFVWRPDAAQGQVVADAASFRTGNPIRDGHVQEILGAEAHPEIRFEVNSIDEIAPAPAGELPEFAVTGRLEVRGRPVRLTAPVRSEPAGNRVIVEGEARLNFSDIGMEPPTLLGFVKRAAQQFTVRARLTGEARPDPSLGPVAGWRQLP